MILIMKVVPLVVVVLVVAMKHAPREDRIGSDADSVTDVDAVEVEIVRFW